MPRISVILCLAIGGPAAAKAVASRIHPIKAQPAPIDDVLEKVRAMLTGLKHGRADEAITSPRPLILLALFGWVFACAWWLAR